ncbi:MAG: hypothetical protein A2516_01260 [Alphaproteobacteria bacterium RIFOXYD12_FULL_60_8]|nr:MAG: hypothetical protein A2516_01260 [Alphaproteobacteria bacterium RIFOXYD12_FULL_60_8]
MRLGFTFPLHQRQVVMRGMPIRFSKSAGLIFFLRRNDSNSWAADFVRGRLMSAMMDIVTGVTEQVNGGSEALRYFRP